MRRRPCTCRGQAATETLLSLMFLMLFIWGAVHMAAFAISKHIASYSAFYCARTAMVEGESSVSLFGNAGLAARQATLNWQMDTLVWLSKEDKTYRNTTRRVVKATMTVPFGAPIFQMVIPWVFVYGSSPLVVDPNNGYEEGDNQ
jgi:hypothetical protein